MPELLARIHALLRRATQDKLLMQEDRSSSINELSLGGITLSPSDRICNCNGKNLELTRLEFDLLELLMKNPGRVFNRRYLQETIWDQTFLEGDRSIDNTVMRLRKKLGSKGELIETVREVGYRFKSIRKLMKRANFFQAKPIQALVSGWAIAAIFWLLILPLAKDAPQMVITWFFAIATFLCGGLAAVRLPRPAGKLRHNWLPEMGYALGLTVGLAILTLVIMKITGHPDLVDRSYFGKGSVILIVFLCAPGFLLSRVVMRGLWAWNDLRKTHFIWDLTHSIFIVAAAVGFLAILITYIIWFKPGDIPAFTASTMISRTIIWSLTMLIVSIGLVIGILILISPFAIGFFI
jgi:DNA-binding winged helix-turn-helix (wHTH) protein